MGLPTVFFVALIAAGGFWWTLHAPESTGNLATGSDELLIDRGCLIEGLSCEAPAPALDLLSSPPMNPRTVCPAREADGFVEVWSDDVGNRGLHWSLPSTANAVYPLTSPWVAAWTVDGTLPGGLRAADTPNGWAVLPDTFTGSEVTVWAGVTGLGGSLRDGLTSLHVDPFGANPDGTVRLAAHVNGDAIVLEVPPTGGFELVKTQEQLRFTEWTTGRLSCAGT
jgi:hypothetical protein